MRPIASVLSLALLAAGITGAQANLTLPVDREVGTLTCETRPTAGHPFGSTPTGRCTFVSDRDGATQTYVAVSQDKTRTAYAATPATLSWRVLTRNGVEKPGMLAGTFADPAEWLVAPRPSAPASLIGRTASLHPMMPSDGNAGRAAKSLPGFELIATSALASR